MLPAYQRADRQPTLHGPAQPHLLPQSYVGRVCYPPDTTGVRSLDARHIRSPERNARGRVCGLSVPFRTFLHQTQTHNPETRALEARIHRRLEKRCSRGQLARFGYAEREEVDAVIGPSLSRSSARDRSLADPGGPITYGLIPDDAQSPSPALAGSRGWTDHRGPGPFLMKAAM